MKKILVYGSLRDGMYNNKRIFGESPPPIKRYFINGYDMFSLTHYPAAVEGTGKIVVEEMDVTDQVFKTIHSMEVGSGYELRFNVENNAFMWLYKEPINGLTKVKNGDWVTFIKQTEGM